MGKPALNPGRGANETPPLASVPRENDRDTGKMPVPQGPQGSQRVIMELAQEEVLRAVYSQRQLQEVMVQFWMNHFNIFAPKGADRWMTASFERDTIRPRALGKFEDLLVATAQSPAMLFYLDNWLSTARENGNRGTDHGHANVMFALGGTVKGGKVYGDWPGLKPEQLNESRDLALTTDFRDVFAEVLVRHIGARHAQGIFPGFAVPPQRFRGFIS